MVGEGERGSGARERELEREGGGAGWLSSSLSLHGERNPNTVSTCGISMPHGHERDLGQQRGGCESSWGVGGSGQACDQPVPLRCTLLPD